MVDINYNSQLQTILDEFLRSNRVSFEKFEVQCGDLVEIAYESRKKLVEVATECQTILVEENTHVRNVSLYLKSRQMGYKESTHVQMDTCLSLKV